jgi:hypothetical protein
MSMLTNYISGEAVASDAYWWASIVFRLRKFMFSRSVTIRVAGSLINYFGQPLKLRKENKWFTQTD